MKQKFMDLLQDVLEKYKGKPVDEIMSEINSAFWMNDIIEFLDDTDFIEFVELQNQIINIQNKIHDIMDYFAEKNEYNTTILKQLHDNRQCDCNECRYGHISIFNVMNINNHRIIMIYRDLIDERLPQIIKRWGKVLSFECGLFISLKYEFTEAADDENDD